MLLFCACAGLYFCLFLQVSISVYSGSEEDELDTGKPLTVEKEGQEGVGITDSHSSSLYVSCTSEKDAFQPAESAGSDLPTVTEHSEPGTVDSSTERENGSTGQLVIPPHNGLGQTTPLHSASSATPRFNNLLDKCNAAESDIVRPKPRVPQGEQSITKPRTGSGSVMSAAETVSTDIFVNQSLSGAEDRCDLTSSPEVSPSPVGGYMEGPGALQSYLFPVSNSPVDLVMMLSRLASFTGELLTVLTPKIRKMTFNHNSKPVCLCAMRTCVSSYVCVPCVHVCPVMFVCHAYMCVQLCLCAMRTCVSSYVCVPCVHVCPVMFVCHAYMCVQLCLCAMRTCVSSYVCVPCVHVCPVMFVCHAYMCVQLCLCAMRTCVSSYVCVPCVHVCPVMFVCYAYMCVQLCLCVMRTCVSSYVCVPCVHVCPVMFVCHAYMCVQLCLCVMNACVFVHLFVCWSSLCVLVQSVCVGPVCVCWSSLCVLVHAVCVCWSSLCVLVQSVCVGPVCECISLDLP